MGPTKIFSLGPGQQVTLGHFDFVADLTPWCIPVTRVYD